jgi:Raf kinase inhibitor-like YbhB/YbcL family protein
MERRAFLAAVGATAGLAGCTIEGTAGGGTGTAAATVSFDVQGVESDHPLTVKYTCDGENVSPKVILTEVAGRIESLAVTLTDPDADGFVHWTVWAIPPNLPDVPESLPRDPEVRLSEVTPMGGESDAATLRQGTNGFGDVGYRGPCPPEGERHNYHITLFGLSEAIDVEGGAEPAAVQSAIDDATIGRATVTTHYERGAGESGDGDGESEGN